MRQGPRGLGRQRGRDACSLGRGRRRERGKTEESAVPRTDPFEAEVGEAGERWGSQVRRRVEERMGQREGGHVARPAEQERGTGADWWVAATVPGGGTG
jgi:hypothetical protein